MNATLVERAPGLVLGTKSRIDPMAAPYAELWAAYMTHDPLVAPLAVDETWYSLYYGTDEPGRVDLLLGRLVPEGTVAPEGLALGPVGGGLYAVFDCQMATIGRTWREIYEQWLPSSGYVEDESRAAFEHYTRGGQGTEDKVQIFVPVKQA